MKLSQAEKRILELILLEYLTRQEGEKIIPEDIRTKFTPETIEFTLTELQAKGLVEYFEGGYVPTKKAQELFRKVEVIKEEIIAWGHPGIKATNKTMIKLTKSKEPEDDSVIGVKANKAPKDLNPKLKERLKLSQNVRITISVNGEEDKILAYGSPALELKDESMTIITKKDSIKSGTVAILSDKAAADLKEEIKSKIRKKEMKIKVLMEI